MTALNIEPQVFSSGCPGPKLLVFGAVHGNEICGPEAIAKAIKALESGKVKLLQGRVTFVPVTNPPAYAKGVRYVDENLNRIFQPNAKPRSREAKLANQLCAMVDDCDALLDIHSTTAKGKPFIYLDFPSRRNRALAQVLGPKFAVTGWPQLYKKFGAAHLSYDTPAYAARQGKDGLLIECGQHQAPTAVAIAYQAIMQTMKHYGLIKGTARPQPLTEIKIHAGFFRQHADDRLAKNWRHLDKVRKGDVLINHANGDIVKAEHDAYVIMPKATAPVGEDWLYLGR